MEIFNSINRNNHDVKDLGIIERLR